MYKVRLYLNSGFDTVNIPGSLSILSTINHFDVSPIDTLQSGFLPSISVRATWNTVRHCDYVCIYSSSINDPEAFLDTSWDRYFYSVPSNGITMTSSDVAEISLIPDYFLTTGGLYRDSTVGVKANFDILSGWSERLSGSESDDGTDPYIQPRLPLQMVSEWYAPEATGGLGQTVRYEYIETTLDLYAMGDSTLDDEAVVYKYGAGTSNEFSVSVPQPKFASKDTTYMTREVISGNSVEAIYGTATLCFIVWDASDTNATHISQREQLLRGLDKARALGVEGAIINHVSIPALYVTYSLYQDTPAVAYLTGRSGIVAINSFQKNYDSTVVNKEIMHTNASSYNMQTGTGDSLSVSPLLIKNADNEGISIYFRTDPHTGGKPYFGFYKYMTNSPTEQDLWRNMVSGFNWKQTPIVFTETSGSALNRARFDLSREAISTSQNIALSRIGLEAEIASKNYDTTLAANTISGVSSALSLNISGAGSAIGEMIGNQIDYNNDVDRRRFEREAIAAQTAIQRKQEAMQYGLQNYSTIVPTVAFPYNSEMVRDFLSNGVFCYQYRMQSEDLLRLDRIITAYGHSVSKIMTINDLYACQHFDYVEANVQLTSTMEPGGSYPLPKWLLDGVARQLSNGVRIWHERPNKTWILNRNNPTL